MNIVTISSKRQITIPKEYLDSLGIGAKSKVILQKEDENIVLKPLKKSIVEEVGGSLKKYIDPKKLGVPFEEIMKETKRIVSKKLAEE